jgi:hypothetical protein
VRSTKVASMRATIWGARRGPRLGKKVCRRDRMRYLAAVCGGTANLGLGLAGGYSGWIHYLGICLNVWGLLLAMRFAFAAGRS